MEKFIFQDKTPEDRARILEDNADFKEEMTYTRTLTEQDLLVERETLASSSIDLAVLREELKVEKDRYKAQMVPVQEQITKSLRLIRTGIEENRATLWAFRNEEESTIEYYDENGERVHVRSMKPSERQRNIMSAVRSGTHG